MAEPFVVLDPTLEVEVAKVAEAYPEVQVRYYRKPGAYRPAPSALLDQVAVENDVALVGIGD